MTITSAANHYRKILSELIDNCPSFASFLNASRKAIEDNEVTHNSYDSYDSYFPVNPRLSVTYAKIIFDCDALQLSVAI